VALTYPLVKSEAEAFQVICNEVASMLTRIVQLLEHNSDLAIDWGAGTTPGYITEDADGNLSTLTYSREDVSNAIGSLDWVRKLLMNQDMASAQGDHLGNLNKLAHPLG
jgi:hypothetical protein